MATTHSTARTQIEQLHLSRTVITLMIAAAAFHAAVLATGPVMAGVFFADLEFSKVTAAVAVLAHTTYFV